MILSKHNYSFDFNKDTIFANDNDEKFQAFGLSPIASIKMQPSLVKRVPPGTKVGYSMTYTSTQAPDEVIATFPVGYADGVWCHLSSEPDSTFNGFVHREKTGELCPIIGRVAMDAVTVRLPDNTEVGESYSLLTASNCPHTSAPALARQLNTISYEVMIHLSSRLPRYYKFTGPDGKIKSITIKACTLAAF